MIKTILTALTESLILESYKDVKDRFVSQGARGYEVDSLINLHKKLKRRKILKANDIDIDQLTNGKSFDEFYSIMKEYSKNLSKIDMDNLNAKLQRIKNKIVAENDEWVVYKIDTSKEARLFKDCDGFLSFANSATTATAFEDFRKKYNCEYFAIVRKNPIGDEFDCIFDEYDWMKTTHAYYDTHGSSHKALKSSLDIPSYDSIIKQIDTDLKDSKLKLAGLFLDGNDDAYSALNSLKKSDLIPFVTDGKFTIKFKHVHGDFDCEYLNLTTLEGCPEKVDGNFDCHGNKLTSLEGAPKEVGGKFNCAHNKLTTLKGCPEKVGGSFDCSGNDDLEVLKDGPKEVGGYYDCNFCGLISLAGAPKIIPMRFSCDYNKLRDLIYGPEKVKDDYSCTHNDLRSLEGGPKEVGGDFFCYENWNLESSAGLGKVRGRTILSLD